MNQVKQRIVFIDWMKALGMLLIVYGHSRAGTNYLQIPPFYEKQLGVVCFVFIAGFSLAREKRSAAEAVFCRLFPVYVWGLIVAIACSVFVGLRFGDVNESNYLPFIFGANILTNDFPANSTTWYIGTYIHVILFWGVSCIALESVYR